jgi:hypothetical protein
VGTRALTHWEGVRYFWVEGSIAGSYLGLMIRLRVLTWVENAIAGSYLGSGIQLRTPIVELRIAGGKWPGDFGFKSIY